jgi:hypothetical protein
MAELEALKDEIKKTASQILQASKE